MTRHPATALLFTLLLIGVPATSAGALPPPEPVNGLLCDLGVNPFPETCDMDGDGFTPASGDCNDADPAINPGAEDRPDTGLVDANCDEIDGTASDAIFVAPSGN